MVKTINITDTYTPTSTTCTHTYNVYIYIYLYIMSDEKAYCIFYLLKICLFISTLGSGSSVTGWRNLDAL